MNWIFQIRTLILVCECLKWENWFSGKLNILLLSIYQQIASYNYMLFIYDSRLDMEIFFRYRLRIRLNGFIFLNMVLVFIHPQYFICQLYQNSRHVVGHRWQMPEVAPIMMIIEKQNLAVILLSNDLYIFITYSKMKEMIWTRYNGMYPYRTPTIFTEKARNFNNVSLSNCSI